MLSFKTTSKISNKEKKTILSICSVGNPEFPGKMVCLYIILINKTVQEKLTKHKLLWSDNYLALLKH